MPKLRISIADYAKRPGGAWATVETMMKAAIKSIGLTLLVGWSGAVNLLLAEDAKSVSQYGITWTFDKAYPVGKFITGDYWVVGPVQVVSVDPAPEPGRNGSEINPKAGPPPGWKQGYDDRGHPSFATTYDETKRVIYPLELQPGQSLVSTASLANIGDKTDDTIDGYARGPLRTAAVLTCLGEVPPADAFRPAFVGEEKKIWTLSDVKRDLLPRLPPPPGARPAGMKEVVQAQWEKAPVDMRIFNSLVLFPDVATQERYLERIWLDYVGSAPSGQLHPIENMPSYGREITNLISTVGLMLLLDDPQGENENLLRLYIQKGIDYWGVAQSNPGTWIADGGISSGRKWPVIFAGLMLGEPEMANVKATSAEDEQTYYGQGYSGAKTLWKIHPRAPIQHEELPPERWKDDPPFKGINNGWRSEAYRGLNGPTWTGQALAARLMGAKPFWNHDAFFDYVDRWVQEAPEGMLVQPENATTAEPLDPAALQNLVRREYQPFPSDFVRLMWETYRADADRIGERTSKKLSVKPAAPAAEK